MGVLRVTKQAAKKPPKLTVRDLLPGTLFTMPEVPGVVYLKLADRPSQTNWVRSVRIIVRGPFEPFETTEAAPDSEVVPVDGELIIYD